MTIIERKECAITGESDLEPLYEFSNFPVLVIRTHVSIYFSPSSIFEIGGAHGILEKDYQQFDEIPWTILEPNPSPVKGCRANFIKGFFDENFTFLNNFDTLVHSHVFEHIYKTNDFMQHLSALM